MTGAVTVCAIHQPNFFPRLGTMAKIYAADVWVVLDNVQFAARDYQHRTRLAGRGFTDRAQWLTLPVHRPAGRSTVIGDVRLCDGDRSAERLMSLFTQHYGRHAHWSTVETLLSGIRPLVHDGARLADIAEATARSVLDLVGWQGTVVRSSSFTTSTERSARLADLTRAVRATTYLCGPSGAGYLDHDVFTTRGLEVRHFPRPLLCESASVRNLGVGHWLASLGTDALTSALDEAGRGQHGQPSTPSVAQDH